ncbi:MAG: right-handed parallel beta-helix repeat-containing protein [Thermoplasmata archaeon]|nr:MAG: right-handed parallel beta-helix repeat-containing protein [Thermoplasmata archaeon]
MGGFRRLPTVTLVVALLIFSTLGNALDQGQMLVGDTPTVNLVGRGLYETISKAVESSRDGDLILVGPGTYKEEVVIDKELMMIGNGPQATYTSTYYVRSDNVVVQGHTFQNIHSSNWNNAAGITTQRSSPYTHAIRSLTVRNCNFNDVQHGVYLFGAQDSTVEDCTFTNSWRGVSIQNWKIGSYYTYSVRNTVQDCTFTNLKMNGIYEGEAVAINSTSSNTVKNNVMDGCPWGVMVYAGDYNVIEGNTIVNSTMDPIYICSVRRGVTVKDNVINNSAGNVDVRHSYGLTMTGNELNNNTGPVHILNSNTFSLSDNEINGSRVLLERSHTGSFSDNNITVNDSLGIEFKASSQVHYYHSIATSNNLNGNPIVYGYGANAPTVENMTAGLVMYAYSTDPTITNVSVEDGDGIRLVNTPNAHINANVTNCTYGIDAYYSGTGLVEGCNIDPGDRGVYGIRMLESVGLDVRDTDIASSSVPAWRLEGADKYLCYNTTFPYTSVSANENGGGELWVYSNLTVEVLKNETLVPMDGVEFHLTEDDSPVYSTPYFGGTDSVSDANGTLGPLTLLDRIYKNYHLPIESDHDLDIWLDLDDTWSRGLRNINMSKDLRLTFETTDVWKPGMPGNFVVTDLPDEDALEITWDLNLDDTQVYSLWSNMSGDWGLVENLTGDTSSYRIDQGLVHGVDYWFALSAWDEVPLQGDRTAPAMVTHVDNVAPLTPGGFDATEVNGTNLTLAWDANTDLDLEGYRVYINDTGGDENGPWVLLTASTGFLATGLWVQDLNSETVYNFVITAVDERPNESPFSHVVTVTTDDITPPDAPLLDVLPEWTNVTTYPITGTGEPGATLRLVLNGDLWDEVTIGPTGEFTVDVDLEEGTNVLIARCIDPSGNLGDLSEEISTILDTVAPDAPVLEALPDLTNVVTHTLSGTAEGFSTVVVLLNDEVVDTIVTESEGTFSLDLTFVEGENTVTAYAIDRAMNYGARTEMVTVVLDTIAPEVPIMDVLPEYTNEEEQTISGTAEPGSTVDLLVDGVPVASVVADASGDYEIDLVLDSRLTLVAVRATDPAGNMGDTSDGWSIILDTEAPVASAGEDQEAIEDTNVGFDGSGSSDNEGIASYQWSFELDGTPVTQDGVTGSYVFPDVVTLTVTLTVTDLAGNTATDTMELTIISSNLPPTLRRDDMTPSKGDTGTKFTFTVEFKDPDGDTGDVLIHIDGESFIMTPDPDDTDTSDGITYTYETKLGKGDHTYYFTGSDSEGNEAEGSSAGEDNAKASPSIKKKTEDSPGFGLVMVIAVLMLLVAVRRTRGRRD